MLGKPGKLSFLNGRRSARNMALYSVLERVEKVWTADDAGLLWLCAELSGAGGQSVLRLGSAPGAGFPGKNEDSFSCSLVAATKAKSLASRRKKSS